MSRPRPELLTETSRIPVLGMLPPADADWDTNPGPNDEVLRVRDGPVLATGGAVTWIPCAWKRV